MPLYSVDGSPTNLYQAIRNQLVKDDQRNTWLDLLMQVTKALTYMHAIDVLHNDLKSNNVVLHKNGNQALTAIIIDFGKASFVADQRVSSAHCNSARHFAPEPNKTKASDIFSLGCIYKDTYLIKELQFSLYKELYRKCDVTPETRPSAKAVCKWLLSFRNGRA